MTADDSTSTTDRRHLDAALEQARHSLRHGGGPFGCVVVRDGEVLATGQNRVVPAHDPTAHAEVVAIRAACAALGTHVLDDCDLYASCEPCPMCLAAAYWAHVRRVVFACTRADAAAAGFDDEHIYRELSRSPGERQIDTVQLGREAGVEVFREWAALEDRQLY